MRHGSLFSGIGGFDLAAEWMGWNNVFHCEWNEFNKKVLKKNFPKSDQYGDIQQFDARKYKGSIDVISGGFPCQDISVAQQSNGGAKGIEGARSGLWKEYARVVREVRPKYIVFENSPMLTDRGLEQVLCDLASMGYNAEWRSFYATEFGYCHLRERIYGVAYANSNGRKGIAGEYQILRETIQTRITRKVELPFPIERIKRTSDFGQLRIHNGLPKRLDKDRIHAVGNAVVPRIAYEIFKAIEQYELKLIA